MATRKKKTAKKVVRRREPTLHERAVMALECIELQMRIIAEAMKIMTTPKVIFDGSKIPVKDVFDVPQMPIVPAKSREVPGAIGLSEKELAEHGIDVSLKGPSDTELLT